MDIRCIESYLGSACRTSKDIKSSVSFPEIDSFLFENQKLKAVKFCSCLLNGRIKIIKPDGTKIPITVSCLTFNKKERIQLENDSNANVIGTLNIQEGEVLKFSLYPEKKYTNAKFACLLQESSKLKFSPCSKLTIHELPLSSLPPKSAQYTYVDIFNGIISPAANRLIQLKVSEGVTVHIKPDKEALVIKNKSKENLSIEGLPLAIKTSYADLMEYIKKEALCIRAEQPFYLYDIPSALWTLIDLEYLTIDQLKEKGITLQNEDIESFDSKQKKLIAENMISKLKEHIEFFNNKDHTPCIKSLTYNDKGNALTIVFSTPYLIRPVNQEANTNHTESIFIKPEDISQP